MNTPLRSLLPAVVMCFVTVSVAQQLPQITQYTSHDLLYNPAVAGSRPLFEMRSAHRNQWVGIQDAPRTFLLGVTTPLGRNMGLGGMLYTDHVGPTRRTGAQATYAYHLKLTSRVRLGFGLSFGLQQFLIDGAKITFHDGWDPLMDGQLRGRTVADATFGVLFYHDDWWVGASAPHLLRNRIWFYDEAENSMSRLAGHYFAMGGYRFHLSDDLRLEPSFLLKYVAPVPAKLDMTATIRYKEQVWLGATYRTNDAICLMVGYWLRRTFQFGYSYDVVTTNLNRYSSGTHEVMLGITFDKARPPAKAAGSAAVSP
jgi:type IX secretion system PorP/SprF family membrane protein